MARGGVCIIVLYITKRIASVYMTIIVKYLYREREIVVLVVTRV